jgi:hypothetical protein
MLKFNKSENISIPEMVSCEFLHLKGQKHKIFYLWFFSWIYLIWASDSHP